MIIMSSLLIVPLLLMLISIGLIYILFQIQYTYWKRKGVIGPKPSFFEGNWTGVFRGKVHFSEVMLDLYKQYKTEPFFGIYVLQKPVLMVNDLDIIKNIMIKDADHFASHGNMVEDPEINFFCENVFSSSGQKWKDLRVKLTPVLTSGKMKNMFSLVLDCQKNMLDFLEEKVDSNVLDFKQILSCNATDVISSCAFGLNSNSFNDPNSEFVKYGKAIINPAFLWKLVSLFENFMPKVLEITKIKTHPSAVKDFYTNLVMKTKQYRLENNIVRNDLMQLLIDLGQKETGGLTDSEIIAQAVVFFVAGYETSSTTGAYTLIHLAKNPHVQDKLRAEIKSVLADGPVSYETLQKMTYTEMVIDETLRLHPPVSHLFRKCTRTYQVPDSALVIDTGTLVFMPIQGIQTDPDIYPDPERYEPERFTKEEKAKRHKCAHLPFGEGPRLCLGMRFAMMTIKLALLGILDKYEVIATDETRITTDVTSLTTCPERAMVQLKRI